MLKFIKGNPYPSFEQVHEIIMNEPNGMGIMTNSEYGQPNHEWMKEIYENPFDTATIKRNGQVINKRGDMQTMQMNYYALLTVLNHFYKKTATKDDVRILTHYNFKDLVSSGWDGIGEWRH